MRILSHNPTIFHAFIKASYHSILYSDFEVFSKAMRSNTLTTSLSKRASYLWTEKYKGRILRNSQFNKSFKTIALIIWDLTRERTTVLRPIITQWLTKMEKLYLFISLISYKKNCLIRNKLLNFSWPTD